MADTSTSYGIGYADFTVADLGDSSQYSKFYVVNLKLRFKQEIMTETFNTTMSVQAYVNGSWITIIPSQSITAARWNSDYVAALGWYSYSGDRYFYDEPNRSIFNNYSNTKIRFLFPGLAYELTYAILDYTLEYKTATIKSCTFNTDYENSRAYANLSLYGATNYSITVNGNTVSDTPYIPLSYFNMGSNTVTVNAWNDENSTSATYEYILVDITPSISSITLENSGNVVDNTTTIDFTISNYTKYEVYVNNTLATTNSKVVDKSKFIIGTNKVHIVAYNTVNDSKFGKYTKTATSSTSSIRLSTLVPTVTNVTVSNDDNLIDNQTTIKWQSTNQSLANIYINDVKIATVTSAKTYTIQPYKLKTGSNTIRVEVVKSAVNGVANSEKTVYYDSVIQMSRIMPSISSLELSSTNIDDVIVVTWTSENTDEVTIYQDDRLLGTTSLSRFEFSQGTFKAGISTVRAVAKRITSADTVTSEISEEYIFAKNSPVIYSLEPSDLEVNIDNSVTVSFSINEYCDRWELKASGVSVSGTDARYVIVPANTFKKGINEIELIAYYTPSYSNEIRTFSKTSTFTGYGAPDAPILDNEMIYNTALPTFTWTSKEQIAYQLIIGSINTGEVEGQSKSYTVKSALENDTEYTLKVRVKNKYNLWSAYATKTFRTSFTVLQKGSINGYSNLDNASIIIEFSNPISDDFKHCEIWRKEKYGEWIRLCNTMPIKGDFIDPYISNNKEYTYKLKSISTDGGATESNTIVVLGRVRGYSFYNVGNMTDNISFKYNAKIVTTYNRNEAITLYAGCEKPSYESDDIIYRTFNMSFETKEDVTDSLIYLIKKSNVILYKDCRGNKCFGMITGNITPDTNDLGITSIQFGFIELSFTEEDIYDGGQYDPKKDKL